MLVTVPEKQKHCSLDDVSSIPFRACWKKKGHMKAATAGLSLKLTDVGLSGGEEKSVFVCPFLVCTATNI